MSSLDQTISDSAHPSCIPPSDLISVAWSRGNFSLILGIDWPTHDLVLLLLSYMAALVLSSMQLPFNNKPCTLTARSGLDLSTNSYNTSFSRAAPPMSLPVRRIKDVLGQLLPSANLESVHESPSTQLARLYTLNLSGSRQLLLSFSPAPAIRSLRHEQALLLSEATLVYFLSNMSTRTLIPSPMEGGAIGQYLPTLLPKMLRHSSNTREIGYPYTIFEPVSGSPLSSQSIYLTVSERRRIDHQIGMLARDLALITSPSGTFGAALKVYGDPFTRIAAPVCSSSSGAFDAGGRGSETWSSAFNSLAEGILRDGEDMSVLLPYDVVRRHFSRLSWRLKAVKTPRLAVLDVGVEANIMIERRLDDAPLPPENTVKVTGLRDWSQGVFGDPLLSSCFEDPSDAFLAGWKSGRGGSLIEDPEGAATRIMLYRCYRAIVAIVTEYYRPRLESSRYELEARRRLTDALAALEKTELEGSETPKRVRSNSAVDDGMGTAKKVKVENGDV